MKIIFLDIDGVLNSSEFPKLHKWSPIDESKVKLLANLAERTGAYVVMHSGWRFWFDDSMQPQTDEARYLYNLFYKCNISLYDKTPDYTTEEIRANKTFGLVKAQEILAWLDEHTSIESYVVIDDFDLGNSIIRTRQVITDNSTGITEIDIQKAFQFLSEHIGV